MRNRLAKLLALLFAVALLGSDTAFTRGYLYSHIGSGFSWSGSAQSWSGSTQAVSCSDWTTYVRNDGTACTSNVLIGLTWANAHAVNSGPTTHSPILANNSFAGGSFASWSSANVGSCTGATFNSVNGTAEDGDSGYATASSLGCTTTSAQITLVQTFTTGGSPASQTYSFWYKAPGATSGDANCGLSYGSVTMTLKIGSTVVASVASPSLDGNWHQVTGSMSAMVSGSNTLTLTATLLGAKGSYSVYEPKISDYTCRAAHTVAQSLQVDNFVLSGVW